MKAIAMQTWKTGLLIQKTQRHFQVNMVLSFNSNFAGRDKEFLRVSWLVKIAIMFSSGSVEETLPNEWSKKTMQIKAWYQPQASTCDVHSHVSPYICNNGNTHECHTYTHRTKGQKQLRLKERQYGHCLLVKVGVYLYEGWRHANRGCNWFASFISSPH